MDSAIGHQEEESLHSKLRNCIRLHFRRVGGLKVGTGNRHTQCCKFKLHKVIFGAMHMLRCFAGWTEVTGIAQNHQIQLRLLEEAWGRSDEVTGPRDTPRREAPKTKTQHTVRLLCPFLEVQAVTNPRRTYPSETAPCVYHTMYGKRLQQSYRLLPRLACR